jgi:hypothetical protein
MTRTDSLPRNDVTSPDTAGSQYAIIHMRDVTEHRAVERQLAAVQRRVEMAFDSAPIGCQAVQGEEGVVASAAAADDAVERWQAIRAVGVSAVGLSVTGALELLIAVLADSVGLSVTPSTTLPARPETSTATSKKRGTCSNRVRPGTPSPGRPAGRSSRWSCSCRWPASPRAAAEQTVKGRDAATSRPFPRCATSSSCHGPS